MAAAPEIPWPLSTRSRPDHLPPGPPHERIRTAGPLYPASKTTVGMQANGCTVFEFRHRQSWRERVWTAVNRIGTEATQTARDTR